MCLHFFPHKSHFNEEREGYIFFRHPNKKLINLILINLISFKYVKIKKDAET